MIGLAQGGESAFVPHHPQVEQQHAGVDVQLVKRQPYLGLVVYALNPQVPHPSAEASRQVGLPQFRQRSVDHEVAVKVEGFVEVGEELGYRIAVVGLL